MTWALPAVAGQAAAAVVLGWLYFRRYRLARPPVGVMNLADVAVMVGGIILIPYLYLALPPWLVATLLTLGIGSMLYFALEPVLAAGWATWLATAALVAADLGTRLHFGAAAAAASEVNNAVL